MVGALWLVGVMGFADSALADKVEIPASVRQENFPLMRQGSGTNTLECASDELVGAVDLFGNRLTRGNLISFSAVDFICVKFIREKGATRDSMIVTKAKRAINFSHNGFIPTPESPVLWEWSFFIFKATE
jgi:hypothetical protein